ncbi:hypothetical protein [Mycobacteroides abscessus]|nr:hypothetical protein [Mycobacteroides abscessus]SKG10647.1 Uncharacterised protein [Mycobacteroides abscessus subsp. massiliense]
MFGEGQWKTVGVSAVTAEMASALFRADPTVKQCSFPSQTGRSDEYEFLPIAFLHQEKRAFNTRGTVSGAHVEQTSEVRVVLGKATLMATVIPVDETDPTPQDWVAGASDDDLAEWVTKSFVSLPVGVFATLGERAPVVGLVLQEHVSGASTRVKLAQYSRYDGVVPVSNGVRRLDLWQPEPEPEPETHHVEQE